MATTSDVYDAVVVGAGPAGICCVGNLLDRKLDKILWIDPSFDGGRVNRMYREVPSNTKVKMFLQFGEGVAPFRKIVSSVPSRSRWEEPSESDGVNIVGRPDKLHLMRDMDQEKGCELSHAADMCLTLTEGLKKTPGVVAQRGRVATATIDDESPAPRWAVHIDSDSISIPDVQAQRLILCSGSSPNNDPLPVSIPNIQNLDLDTALSPTRLSAALSSHGPLTISVIGASHSAILVLMNLCNLASSARPDLKIRWFTRHDLRYAEYMDGWILRDNTGLKGDAADWAKANLEPEVFDHSDVSRYMTKIEYEKGMEKETFSEHIPGSTFYVQAIGYTRDPIPVLKTKEGKKIDPQFDHQTGGFAYVQESEDGKIGDLAKVPGLYGAGIAFPERVKDPHGNVEYAVGFFKFMKFVKRVVGQWD